jgi:flagellar biosynthesis/type III secretory pathway protein FliH
VLAAARAQADRWTRGARIAFRQAREAGRREGQAEGLAEVLAVAVARDDEVAAVRAGFRAELNTLVVETFERFFGAADRHDLLARSLDAALAQMSVPARLRVAVAPEDHAALVAAAAPNRRPVPLVPDAAVPPGTVLVESDRGEVRISLDRHLDTLRRALAAAGGRDA